MKVDDYLSISQKILAQRGKEYGDFNRLHQQIAKRFSLALGQEITPYQAARLLMELKLARLDMGRKQDSLIDLIGYASIAGALADD